jgi:hypothetical protein
LADVLRHRRQGRRVRKDLLDKTRTTVTGTEIEITTDRLRLRRVRRESISRQIMDERIASETVRLNRSF